MGIFADTYSKRVKFTDGEALDGADLTQMQLAAMLQQYENFMISSVTDVIDDGSSTGVLEMDTGQTFNTLGFSDSMLAYAPYPSCGYALPSGSANTITFVPGPLLLVGEPFGAIESEIFPIRLGMTGAPAALVTAVGDATNPRIDLIEIGCSWVDGDSTARSFEDAITRAKTSTTPSKSRGVSVNIRIRQGVPGAVPAYPSPSTGFAALAAIFIPANQNAPHSSANIRDLRMPLGKITAYDVPAHQFYRQGGAPWTLDVSNWYATAPASASFVYAQCPIGSKTGRVVAIGVAGEAGLIGTQTCNLKRITHDGGTPTFSTLCDLQIGPDLFANPFGFRTKSMLEIMDCFGGLGTGVLGTRASGTRVGTPIWCSGYPAGVARPRIATADSLDVLALEINGSSASTLSMVRFWVAQGL